MTTKYEAKRYLCDVAPEQCFWVNNGPILKSIDDLSNELPNMSDETYRHHVCNGNNDFSKWVNNIIGDKKLANDLLSSKTKDSAMKKLNSRLAVLKKKSG